MSTAAEVKMKWSPKTLVASTSGPFCFFWGSDVVRHGSPIIGTLAYGATSTWATGMWAVALVSVGALFWLAGARGRALIGATVAASVLGPVIARVLDVVLRRGVLFDWKFFMLERAWLLPAAAVVLTALGVVILTTERRRAVQDEGVLSDAEGRRRS